MLHRAFSRLGQMGLNCTSVDQPVAVTRERIFKGSCYVAVCDRRLVGTITLYEADRRSESAWYQRPAVASIHQLAVDPQFQDKGLGTRLLKLAERWAQERGYGELALDTPQPAKHLVTFYAGHGYRLVERVRFPGRHYCSVVLSKRLAQRDIPYALVPPLRHVKRCGSSVPIARQSGGIRCRISLSDRRHSFATRRFSELPPHPRC